MKILVCAVLSQDAVYGVPSVQGVMASNKVYLTSAGLHCLSHIVGATLLSNNMDRSIKGEHLFI